MTKTLLLIGALLALGAPAALAAPPDPSPSPAQLCRQQQASMSAADFAALYPGSKPKSAFARCVSRQTQQASQNADNAATACKAERASLGETAFADKYGTNPNKRNAFGKCVSAKAKQAAASQQQATLNAAKKCKAERASLGETAFASKYGTNPNKRNAFGKCVSQTARA
jgi:hypothetical protein